MARFTDKQGQYLSYIDLYTRLNRRPPATTDIAWFFQVTAPTAHNMVKQLCKNGLAEKIPRTPRSLRVLIPKDELPELL
jgi:Mn-dependent DtxR family transcriptional regulator